MAISSKKSLGKNSMYVQSDKGGKKRSPKRPGSSSIKSTGKRKTIKSDSSDSIEISAGNDFYSTYQDDTLESSLTQRGFSQMRPEIVGAFEFIPPISSDAEDTSQADGQVVYSTTGAGELIDMQSQLKTLRYKETMRFLKHKVGLQTKSAGENKFKWDTSDTLTMGMWKEYEDDIDKAKSVLDFLTASLLIFDFKNFTDVKLNKYLDIRSRRRGGSSYSSNIQTRLNKYDDNFIQNKSPGILDLNEYFKDSLKYPDEYYNNASSSALMMQLVSDTVYRAISHKANMAEASTPGGDWSPGSLPGIDFKSDRPYLAAKQMSKISSTLDLVGTGRTAGPAGSTATDVDPDSIDSEDTQTSYFTKGDFFEIFTLIADSKNIKPFYIVARDFINHCALKSETGGRTHSGMLNMLTALIGYDPTTSQDNIANITDKGGNKIALNAFRKSIGNEQVVATFNEGWGDTTSGDKEMITGQSYYADSFFKNEKSGVRKSIQRFTKLASDLETLESSMYSFCKTYFAPFQNVNPIYSGLYLGANQRTYKDTETGEAASVQPVDLVGQVGAGHMGKKAMENPASLFQRIYESIAERIESDYAPSDGGIGVGETSGYAAMMASAMDPEAAWAGLKWIWSKMRKSENDTDDNEENLEASAMIYLDAMWESLGLDESTSSGAHNPSTIQFHGNGYDSDTVPLNLYAYGSAGTNWADYFGSDPWDDIGAERLTCDYNGPFELSYLSSTSDWNVKKKMWDLLLGDTGAMYTLGGIDYLINDVTEAISNWEESIIGAYEMGDSISSGDKTSDLKIDKYGRVMMGWIIILILFKESLTLCVPRSIHGTDSTYRIGWSRRAAWSLVNANDIKGLNSDERTSTIAGSDYSEVKSGEWDPSSGFGFRDAIDENLDLFYKYFITMMEYEVAVWNNMYYIVEICDKVKDTVNDIVSTFSDSSTSNDLIKEMKAIQADSKLSSILFSSLTPDQVRLSRYLHSALGQTNRAYPYLPASSAVIPNTSKNLGTASRLKGLLDSDDMGTKRIFAIGLPAGLVEFLRRSASRSLLDPDFNESTVVKISLWKRNLLTETTADVPIEYLFDLKRFMLDGRRSWPLSMRNVSSYAYAKEIDSAWQYFQGQKIDDLLNDAVILRYDRYGVGRTFQGAAYSDDFREKIADDGTLDSLTEELMPTCANITGKSKDILDEIFYNHVTDYYLKLYLRLTSGIDVREEVFCFKDEDTEIIEADSNLSSRRKKWASLLKSMYGTRDMASSITYQRVMGELDRSIFLSPERYKNRIIYPKIFDRVFCVLVDESWWESDEPESYRSVDFATGINRFQNVAAKSKSARLSLKSKTDDPSFFQYYVTVTILPEFD